MVSHGFRGLPHVAPNPTTTHATQPFIAELPKARVDIS